MAFQPHNFFTDIKLFKVIDHLLLESVDIQFLADFKFVEMAAKAFLDSFNALRINFFLLLPRLA
jgi:hypothetical protein